MIYMYLYAWWLWLRSLEMLIYVNPFQASVRFTCKYEYEEHELREQGFYLHFESDLIWLHEVLSQQPQPKEIRWRRDRAGGGPLGWVGAASSVTCILAPFGVQRCWMKFNEARKALWDHGESWYDLGWLFMVGMSGYVSCIGAVWRHRLLNVELVFCQRILHGFSSRPRQRIYIKIILHHIMWYDILYEKRWKRIFWHSYDACICRSCVLELSQTRTFSHACAL